MVGRHGPKAQLSRSSRARPARRNLTPSEIYSQPHAPAETSGMTTLPAQSSGGAAALAPQARSKKLDLKTEDFIKMMITQLQNQDPLEPAKNQELLAQMSQIGQLQSSSTLQESLQGMVLQNQIGSASSLIGKTVQGFDGADDPVTGLVNSVKVGSDGVSLELDNGKTLLLSRVTQIAPSKLQ